MKAALGQTRRHSLNMQWRRYMCTIPLVEFWYRIRGAAFWVDERSQRDAQIRPDFLAVTSLRRIKEMA